jgi:hypothetical protein
MNPINILKFVFMNFLLNMILISRPTDSMLWKIGLQNISNESSHVLMSEIVIPEFASKKETKTT